MDDFGDSYLIGRGKCARFCELQLKTYEMKIQPINWLKTQMQCEKFTKNGRNFWHGLDTKYFKIVCTQTLRKGLLSQNKDHTGCGEKIYTLLLQSIVIKVCKYFPASGTQKRGSQFFCLKWAIFCCGGSENCWGNG